MFPYIVCTCGRSIGDIYDLYLALVFDLINKEKNLVKNTLNYQMFTHENANRIFNILNIPPESMCCRTHIMTQVQFKDVY